MIPKRLLLVMAFVITFLSQSCSLPTITVSPSSTSSVTNFPEPVYPFWHVNPAGTYFQTNDLNRAQQEVSFRIVVPSYLPESVGDRPSNVRGFIKGSEVIDADLMIFYTSGTQIIGISEYLNRKSMTFILGDSSEYYEYKTRIIQFHLDSNSITYAWDNGDISIMVEFQGFTQPETKRVIESMII